MQQDSETRYVPHGVIPIDSLLIDHEGKLIEDVGWFWDHADLRIELVDWVIQHQIPGDFTMDSYFTHAEILNHIHMRQRFYVGGLKSNRKVQFKGQTLKVSDLAKLIPATDRKMAERDGKRQFYFTKAIRIDGFTHRVRVVILWKHQNDALQPSASGVEPFAEGLGGCGLFGTTTGRLGESKMSFAGERHRGGGTDE